MTPLAESAAGVLRMLDAQSVAVVGASGDPEKIGYLPVYYLVKFGYEGRIYPINPRLTEVEGLTVYPSLTDLPEIPDLVAIMVGAPLVPDVLEEAGRLGIPAAVIISSGFAEVGEEGAELQRRLIEIADATGIWVCGPNSVGIINAATRMALTFTAALTSGPLAPPGRIGIVSQSGAFGTVLYGLARDQALGLHTYISAGNEAQLGVSDYIAALVEHPEITTIGGYIEAIRDGAAFAEAAAAARGSGQPIVLVKVGASEAGTLAAASHTGALTGDDRAYEAAFGRFGVARAIDEQHLLDLLEAFDVLERLPSGNRVAIASMSGGAGVLLCDAAEEHGLAVLPFSDELVGRLGEVLPPYAAVANPVDFTGQFVTNTAGLRTVVAELAAAETADAVILFAGLGWTAGGAWVDPVIDAAGSGAPVIVVSPLATEDQRARLRKAGIPTYHSPLQAIRILETLVTWNTWEPPEDVDPITSSWSHVPGILSEATAKALLADAGLTIPRGVVVTSAREAEDVAASFGSRFVMKVSAPGLSHKTEAGGVRIGVTPAAAGPVFEEIMAAVTGFQPDVQVDGVLLEEMIDEGVEAIIGSTWHEPFGHVVMVGLGGVSVELLGDVVFALAPIGPGDARILIESLRSYPLLDGYRGAVPLDVEALAETVSVVSRLAAGAGSQLRELDLNPVKVLPAGKGAVILDALAVLEVSAE